MNYLVSDMLNEANEREARIDNMKFSDPAASLPSKPSSEVHFKLNSVRIRVKPLQIKPSSGVKIQANGGHQHPTSFESRRISSERI